MRQREPGAVCGGPARPLTLNPAALGATQLFADTPVWIRSLYRAGSFQRSSVSFVGGICEQLINCANLTHELQEHIGQQRLWAIRQSLLGMIVNLDHDSIGSRGYGGARPPPHLWAFSLALHPV